MAAMEGKQPGVFRYGVDAPYVPTILATVGVVAVILGFVLGGQRWLVVIGALFILQAAIYMHTTLRGKHRVWSKLLGDLRLRGDEQTLDVGCGRGAVLVATAGRLGTGRAHGVDLWRSRDQSGNSERATEANAEASGVAERVELHTGDMTQLPFTDGTFDVVTSSLAIHNLPTAEGRCRALDEAMRVLRPGGRLVIADIRNVRRYGQHLRASGGQDVKVRGLGPDFWFAGPWQSTSVVTATKATP
jgi:arsenite methyltransferase